MASEYGYTFNEIGQMTLREIDIAMRNIGIRKHNEVALNVNIHGGKMSYKEKPKSVKQIEITKEQNEMIDKAIKERFGG